jgi:Fe-S cluster biogenesis protein NfuA
MLALRLAGGQADAMAVAAAVRIFKRATSLGGTESVIEHRRSTEGASSPVPDDLLRLSIGLEAVDDLRTDLEAALDAVARAGSGRAPAILPEPAPSEADELGARARLAAAIDESIGPLVIARGGVLRVSAVREGTVTLEVSGTPGAMLPVAAQIEEALHRVLDEEVNPAVAAHGGRVVLVDMSDGRATIRLEGGCQGCALAEVTVRQGVERLLRVRVPEITAVADVTDHGAGTAPYFAPGKRRLAGARLSNRPPPWARRHDVRPRQACACSTQ